MKFDASNRPSPHGLRNRAGRMLWALAYPLLYRWTPKPMCGWRRMVLRCFGAKIGRGAHPHRSVRIWAPWNLEMGDHSCLGPQVDCYCVDRIVIGAHATVSQYSFLCTASHDFEQAAMPLVTAPIVIGDGAWITADVFVGPGVTVGEGAVVAVRSTVLADVEPMTVVGGSPARFLRHRRIKSPE